MTQFFNINTFLDSSNIISSKNVDINGFLNSNYNNNLFSKYMQNKSLIEELLNNTIYEQNICYIELSENINTNLDYADCCFKFIKLKTCSNKTYKVTIEGENLILINNGILHDCFTLHDQTVYILESTEQTVDIIAINLSSCESISLDFLCLRNISIVMPYKNRIDQTLLTLKSIEKQRYHNIEIIIYDDGSNEKHNLSPHLKDFSLDIKIISDVVKKKTYTPSINYNICISEASGDIIVLQNPECFHWDNVLFNINEELNNYNYLTAECLSMPNFDYNEELKLLFENNKTINSYKAQYVEKIEKIYFEKQKSNLGWYNHHEHRKCNFHFLSAITRKNIDLLRGFDETYADNMWFDDNEIRQRIYCLGLDVKICENIFCIHQFHNRSYVSKDSAELIKVNQEKINKLRLQPFVDWTFQTNDIYYKQKKLKVGFCYNANTINNLENSVMSLKQSKQYLIELFIYAAVDNNISDQDYNEIEQILSTKKIHYSIIKIPKNNCIMNYNGAYLNYIMDHMINDGCDILCMAQKNIIFNEDIFIDSLVNDIFQNTRYECLFINQNFVKAQELTDEYITVKIDSLDFFMIESSLVHTIGYMDNELSDFAERINKNHLIKIHEELSDLKTLLSSTKYLNCITI